MILSILEIKGTLNLVKKMFYSFNLFNVFAVILLQMQ